MISQRHEAGRVGFKAILYFEVASTLALAVGLIVVNLFKPGVGMPSAVWRCPIRERGGTSGSE